jgi:hypothetical protein
MVVVAMDGREGEWCGKRLDMQLDEQGEVQVISTHVRFSDMLLPLR